MPHNGNILQLTEHRTLVATSPSRIDKPAHKSIARVMALKASPNTQHW